MNFDFENTKKYKQSNTFILFCFKIFLTENLVIAFGSCGSDQRDQFVAIVERFIEPVAFHTENQIGKCVSWTITHRL